MRAQPGIEFQITEVVIYALLLQCMYYIKDLRKISLKLMRKLYCTVQPRLSGPRLSGTSIIRTSQRPKSTLSRMCRRRDR